MREISYKPRSVRETLVELKNSSELAVDLAYSALLYENRDLAEEVLELESRVQYLQYHARIALMLAARRADEAETLVGIFQVAESAVAITAAAADIAGIVRDEVGIPDEVRGALPDAEEVTMRATVGEDSSLAGERLGDVELESETGVRVIAIRREDEWLIDPGAEDALRSGDVMLGSGPTAGVEETHEMATGEPFDAVEHPESEIEGLERAVDAVVEMKDLSELAVGLGYSAVLFDSDSIAREVASLESTSDALREDVEMWVIEAGERVQHPRQLRGLLRLGTASEEICDAAREMADVVLRDVEVHPVFGQAVRESNEIIASVTVAERSDLAGRRLGEIDLDAETGMFVMAIHRENGWVYDPNGDTEVLPGDVLIARGPRLGERQLRNLAGG